jgi:hypothetical protein
LLANLLSGNVAIDTAASVIPHYGSVFNDLWLFHMYSKRQCSTALKKPYLTAAASS